jgi:hypothetical protein
MKRTWYVIAVLGWLLAACGGPVEQYSLWIEDIELVAEYPLYEGANTATGVWVVSTEALTGIPGMSAKALKQVRVKGAVVRLADETNQGLIEEVTLQLTASATNMQKVAFISPIHGAATVFDLTVADNQKGLVELFKQEQVVLVADINIREDFEDDLRLLVSLELEVEFKNP